MSEIIQTSGPFKIQVSETLDFLIVTREWGETLPDDAQVRKNSETHTQMVDFIHKVMQNRKAVWECLKSMDNETS